MFKKQTNWIAITGAPSSGKTSVIDDLEKRGYRVEQEAARELIDHCLKHGKTLDDVQKDGHWLQDAILSLKVHREKKQDPQELIFLDRGIPDSLTYYHIAGMDDTPVRTAATEFHYRAVFVFDRLPIVQDGVRTESEALANLIDHTLEDDYRELGYDPVRVPVMPIAQRTDFILECLGIKKDA